MGWDLKYELTTQFQGSSSASGSAACFSCLKGTFLNSDTMECINCAAGTYADTEGASSCTVTGINQYQDEEKAETFKKCDAVSNVLFHGTIREGSQFNSNSNPIQKYFKRFELTCPLQGTIAASKGATKCDSCDRGLYRPSTSDKPVCAACSPGTFAENKGSGKSLVSVHILYRSHFEFLRYWHLHAYVW